ncbi:MAG: cyclic pyranopterin monophosphate synthase MoaC [Vulcanimicrobiaceae bacterium]
MSPQARSALLDATLTKGDAFATAQIAGIFAAKQTAALIPLCHALALDSIEVTFEWEEDGALLVRACAVTTGPTGVEMEVMVASAIAALTIYDMTKALDKGITIEQVYLVEKTGGKSGTWQRK